MKIWRTQKPQNPKTPKPHEVVELLFEYIKFKVKSNWRCLRRLSVLALHYDAGHLVAEFSQSFAYIGHF